MKERDIWELLQKSEPCALGEQDEHCALGEQDEHCALGEQDEHCALGEQEHYWIRRCDVKVYSVTKSRHDFTIPHNWVLPIICHKLRSWRANKVGRPQS